MTGPLSPQAQAQDRSLQAVLSLIVTAAGIGFLALGLRQWNAISLANDTSGARSPVPYAAHARLPTESSSLPAGAKWVVLVSQVSAADACEQMMSQIPLGSVVSVVGIVSTGGSTATVAACWPLETGKGHLEKLAAMRRVVGAIPSDGFIVTDRTGRVVYGSYDMSYLAHVLPSLALLD